MAAAPHRLLFWFFCTGYQHAHFSFKNNFLTVDRSFCLLLQLLPPRWQPLHTGWLLFFICYTGWHLFVACLLLGMAAAPHWLIFWFFALDCCQAFVRNSSNRLIVFCFLSHSCFHLDGSHATQVYYCFWFLLHWMAGCFLVFHCSCNNQKAATPQRLVNFYFVALDDFAAHRFIFSHLFQTGWF